MKLKVLELDDNFVDKNGDIMPINADVTFKNRVIINKNFSSNIEEVLGTATLLREDNSFYIQDMILIDEIEDVVLNLLTPAIGGKQLTREENKITKFSIDMVSLGMSKNADPKIKSIGEQRRENTKKD